MRTYFTIGNIITYSQVNNIYLLQYFNVLLFIYGYNPMNFRTFWLCSATMIFFSLAIVDFIISNGVTNSLWYSSHEGCPFILYDFCFGQICLKSCFFRAPKSFNFRGIIMLKVHTVSSKKRQFWSGLAITLIESLVYIIVWFPGASTTE